ncbi:hypothetical protein BJ998_009182 [Kutzneria kofuensis]|uniref:Uncharacterized protein n=1 Tax=Kutzneria kofuensis TaxID=103725 RepID=A0A7W9NN07_9PSEU|nr:hypothetical protein [Kutzneria kofuensis]
MVPLPPRVLFGAGYHHEYQPYERFRASTTERHDT